VRAEKFPASPMPRDDDWERGLESALKIAEPIAKINSVKGPGNKVISLY